jgi:hypothetical protein
VRGNEIHEQGVRGQSVPAVCLILHGIY